MNDLNEKDTASRAWAWALMSRESDKSKRGEVTPLPGAPPLTAADEWLLDEVRKRERLADDLESIAAGCVAQVKQLQAHNAGVRVSAYTQLQLVQTAQLAIQARGTLLYDPVLTNEIVRVMHLPPAVRRP